MLQSHSKNTERLAEHKWCSTMLLAVLVMNNPNKLQLTSATSLSFLHRYLWRIVGAYNKGVGGWARVYSSTSCLIQMIRPGLILFGLVTTRPNKPELLFLLHNFNLKPTLEELNMGRLLVYSKYYTWLGRLSRDKYSVLCISSSLVLKKKFQNFSCRMATNEVEAAYLASLSYEINKNAKYRENVMMAFRPYIDTEIKIVSWAGWLHQLATSPNT